MSVKDRQMTPAQLEKRVAVLEAELAKLKAQGRRGRRFAPVVGTDCRDV